MTKEELLTTPEVSAWERYQRYRERALAVRNHVHQFLRSAPEIQLDPRGRITSAELYDCYTHWCREHSFVPWRMREFCIWLNEQSDQYGLRSSTNIPTGTGKRLRGYWGIRRADDTDTAD